MGFLNLRSNNKIYIFHKDLNPTLEVGKVLNVSPPTPRIGASVYTDLVVDILVDVNGVTKSFQKLPANMEIADLGNMMVISCSRDIMNNEVLSMKQKSEDVINSIDIHKVIIENCDGILQQLNPEIAELKRREEENQALREEINSLKDMFKDFINQLK